jgi:RNA polymerase sigma-70 factor (ECF subfamily)
MSDERTVSAGTSESPVPAVGAAPDGTFVLDTLRRGDESAFLTLVDRYSASLLRLALTYVHNRQIAEEVVQETWLGVLLGLNRFEGRSALKTWIYRILINTAKTRAQREGRSVPLSALDEFDLELEGPSVEPDRFLSPNHPQWPGHWVSLPPSWDDVPEERLLAQETRAFLREAINALPMQQREVVTLRDIEGWPAEEVCNILEISETNQRVLLHRARSKIRRALERYFTED